MRVARRLNSREIAILQEFLVLLDDIHCLERALTCPFYLRQISYTDYSILSNELDRKITSLLVLEKYMLLQNIITYENY